MNNTSSEYGSVSASVCAEYDQHYKITRQEVEDYVAYLIVFLNLVVICQNLMIMYNLQL